MEKIMTSDGGRRVAVFLAQGVPETAVAAPCRDCSCCSSPSQQLRLLAEWRGDHSVLLLAENAVAA